MRLYEFDQDSALVTKIVALSNQLKQGREDGKIPDNYTLDDLLNYFQKYDVILDADDLYNMIQVPPLKDVIKNIQGNDVIFTDQKEKTIDMPKTDDNDKVVAKMARRALKK